MDDSTIYRRLLTKAEKHKWEICVLIFVIISVLILTSTFRFVMITLIYKSKSTPRDTVILPRSAVAIVLVFVAKLETAAGSEDPTHPQTFRASIETRSQGSQSDLETTDDLLSRLSTLHKNHQNTIVIMVSAVFGEEEINLVTSRLVLRLLPKAPLFLIAHGDAQAAAHVQLIAKATQVEAKRLIRSRISAGIQRTLSADDPLRILTSVLDLTDHDASVLADTFACGIAEVAMTSADDLLSRTPLDQSAANAIFNFFEKDTVLP